MKVLLDENLDHRVRRFLAGHDVFTVDYMRWSGLKNGELLRFAEDSGFDVFLTGDKNLAYQQNLLGRHIASLTLSSVDIDILERNVPQILASIEAAVPGSFLRVECDDRKQSG